MDVVVGRVAKAHGIHGELAVEVRTDSPERRFAEGAVVHARLHDGETRPLTIEGVRPHRDQRLLVRFTEVPTRDDAEPLRGVLLYADTADLPPIENPDEFYDHQLTGLDVVLADGTALGTVRDVTHGPGGELLIVQRSEGADVLVPFVREIVPEVDLGAGRVVIDPPEGLIP
ncbi:16S rRNA processing protein RimM [Herbihabitans rhizosphaerae]|uniref:Ribosome maturation factor RimM n=1 Tax=Herbihabitans rhizosphaerae TaxID=1872711 RepID=A0A4Q7KL54_9PSEU|nr:ribosome maturation factor RimM [Herbihabitans rhizosphaerae]RZS34666.1 16S rRNA processing protein RimM [Herbihabitans rhizosphaerae]